MKASSSSPSWLASARSGGGAMRSRRGRDCGRRLCLRPGDERHHSDAEPLQTETVFAPGTGRRMRVTLVCSR